KICICTTPIRTVPTTFPPFGSMAIIQSLRKINKDPKFFNIDYFRYSEVEIIKYISENQFDIIGISAVVSTAYVFTKKLSKLIRKYSPKTIIILGGNLAASAEIVLRKTEVDICVIGDGEFIIQELVLKLEKFGNNPSSLKDIEGISFLDKDNKFVFTGYGKIPLSEEIEWPDYTILEQDGSLDYFITKDYQGLVGDLLKDESTNHFTAATVIIGKGCTNRCTFCHRFEKGYRIKPKNSVIDHIKHLKERYNTKYISISDENFGGHKTKTFEIVEELGKLDIVWRAGGVRVRTITKESLEHWKKNGCEYVIFGIESGSDKILKIMEKNATVEENINAMKWVSEAGLKTLVQLVIGMPGETDETIEETINYLKEISPFLEEWEVIRPSSLISINYAQALPGTPLYEYARENGYIGNSVDEEEKYLIKISDIDAYSTDHFINYTGLPLLKVLLWRWKMITEIDAYNLKRRIKKDNLSLVSVFTMLLNSIFNRKKSNEKLEEKFEKEKKSGYFNIKENYYLAPLLLNKVTKTFVPLLLTLVVFIKQRSILKIIQISNEYFFWLIF
ncbi:MAG: B12-binding domain-containing radical SAM protein, partial [Nanoarchaeota archaeon]|nr:B12-binding domain-containing radical SAM protein [Nanoarchaeota archaeon]